MGVPRTSDWSARQVCPTPLDACVDRAHCAAHVCSFLIGQASIGGERLSEPRMKVVKSILNFPLLCLTSSEKNISGFKDICDFLLNNLTA